MITKLLSLVGRGIDLPFADRAPLPMVMVQGPTHVVCYVNPAFCQLRGVPQDQLLGLPFSDLVPKNDRCLALLDRVSRSGMPASHTEEEHSSTHPLFWSYTMWQVIIEKRSPKIMMQVTETAEIREKTVAMNEALIVGSVRQHELAAAAEEANTLLQVEINERKQAEEALRQAQAQLTDRAGHLEGLVTRRTEELTATNMQLEAFVYSIAHDLRAPLRSMQAFSTMLLEEAGPVLSQTSKDYADRINASALFLDAMLIDLLDFSCVSQKSVELRSVSLARVIEAVLSQLEADIQASDAQVESVGPWPDVIANESSLSQVLFNLINNALKFVRPGIPPCVRLWTEQRSSFTRVWVEDEGIGIALDHQTEIFRLFTRLDGEKYRGTGMGLAIVQKAVERMGGQFGVESILGQGSRFWFELRSP